MYATGEWNLTNGQLMVDWPAMEYCDFVLSASIVDIIVAGIQFVR